MSKRLRILSKGESGVVTERSFVDVARAQLEQILADGATVILIVAEMPDDRIAISSVPSAHAVVRGMHDLLTQQLYPDPPGE